MVNDNISNNNNQMSADRAAASLSLLTKLSEGLMPKQNPMQEEGNLMQESPQTPESAPGEEMSPEVVEEPQDTMKEDYEAKMTEMGDKIGELEMDIELLKKAITNEKLPE